MLQFAASYWLVAPAAAALLGMWALWRGQRRVRRVPTTKLWQGLAGTAESSRRRAIDPLWLLVFLAAVLAALALAQPQWTRVMPPPDAPIQWSIRSVNIDGKERSEAWLRLPDAAGAPYTLAIDGKEQSLAADALRTGAAIPLAPAGDKISLELRSQSRRLAAQEFTRPATPSFGLLEITSAGTSLDPALRRAFTVQNSASDPTIQPTVALVNAAALSPQDTAALDSAALVIAQSQTPLPGITPGTLVTVPEGGWTPALGQGTFKWPAFAPLADVRVAALRQATFSSGWQTIATAGGQPWIALREDHSRDGTAHTWLWLASDPAAQTNWPLIPSFVPFFAELVSRTMNQQPQRIIEWQRSAAPPAQEVAAPVPLSPWLGTIAIALLLSAGAWFLRRSMPAQY